MKRFEKIRNGLRKLLANNKFYVVLSILIAASLWAFVGLTVNTEGYTIVKDVPIKFETSNETAGFTVIKNDITSVDLVVGGNRSVIGVLTADDFIASVDYSNITEAGNYDLDVEVAPKTPSSDYKISSYSGKTVSVFLDKVISKKFEIQTELLKATVAEGYVLQKPVTSKTELTLTGPESDLSKIDSCVAIVNINGELTESVTKTANIEYRNADGVKVTLQDIKSDTETVDVSVSVLMEKEVAVKFSYTNLPDGFTKDTLSYTMSVNKIKIAGPEETVKDLGEVNVGYIDVAALSLDGKVELNVELPAGFVNLEEVDTVTVEFDFSNFTQRYIPTTTINLVNVPASYDATVLTKRINNIRIIGNSEEVTKLTMANVVAEVDLASVGDITVGTQTVPVKIIVNSEETVWAVGQYTVNISVKEKN